MPLRLSDASWKAATSQGLIDPPARSERFLSQFRHDSSPTARAFQFLYTPPIPLYIPTV